MISCPKRNHTSLPTLIAKLDKVFSDYIRKRGTTLRPDGKRWGKCVTCGRMFTIDRLDCGHFQTRDHKATRWHVHNAHCQCRWCNGDVGTKSGHGKGEQYTHGKYIDRTYGDGTASKLEYLSRRGKSKFMRYELEQMIEIFKRKLEELP